MGARRWWRPFVGVATVVWILLFALDGAIRLRVVAASPSTAGAIGAALRWLLVVFLLDLFLLYRWSDEEPWAFLRTNWFLVLTVVPWFRPLRLFRAGRVARLLAASRRVGSLLVKLRRTCRRAWQRLRGRER